MRSRPYVAAVLCGGLLVLAGPALAEPTEGEMKEALLQAMQNRGGTRSGGSSVATNNPINGMSISLTRFTKIACEKALSRPGYMCDYEYTMRANAHSNEGTAAGNNHAAAVNRLMGAMGASESRGAGTKRFVKSSGRWIAMEDG